MPSPTGRMLVARGLYRQWLAKYFSKINLAGLASDDEPILLRNIYVPLVLTPEKIPDHASESAIHHGGKGVLDWLESRKRVLFISGEAGSGKTTLISSIVDSLAGDVGDTFNRQFEGHVPFPIRLREAPIEKLDSLDGLVDWWLEEARKETPDLKPADVKAFLDSGKGILLLDGLDEVGTIERRTRVMRWLRSHRWLIPSQIGAPNFKRWIGGSEDNPNIAVVTARPSGFEGLGTKDLPPSLLVHVAPFSHEQIRNYLQRWFELRPLRSNQRQSTVESLVERLISSEQANRLLPLARRPAYLASLAFVHGTRGELPYTRAALYEQLVEAYIEMLDRQKGILDRAEQAGELPVWDRQEKIEVLSGVAFQAHVGATAKEKEKNAWERKEEDRRFLWTREELTEAVSVAVENGAERFRTVRPEHVSPLTSYFVARTGLLVESREGRYQFGHLSFQEYLTALFILNLATAASDKAAALEQILFPRLGEPGWLEVGVLALAVDANRSSGKGHEPVLARLDLKNPSHLEFLAQLLSGEEIRFTADERRAWLLVWLTFWATREDHGASLDSVFRFPTNRGPLEEAWRTVCAALGNGQSGLAALKSLVEKTLASLEQPAQPVRRGLDALVVPAGDAEAEPKIPAAKRVWSSLPAFEDFDLPAARLLSVPLLGYFVPPEAEKVLHPLPSHVELFRQPEPGRVVPTGLQYSLDSWAFGSHSLLQELAERTPLLWWLQDEFFALRAASVSPGAMPFLLWRRELRKLILGTEQSWLTSLLISGNKVSEKNRSRARDLALARDRDLALALALARDRDRDRDRDLALALARDLALALARDLALDRDLARDRDRALALARDRDLALALARDLALARTLARDLARARALETLITLLDQREKNLERNGPFRDHATDLFQVAIQSVSTGWLLDRAAPVKRSDLTSSLAAFRNAESVTAPLAGTHLAEQAVKEWEDVLASPFSPIPMLEDALSREWEELPTDPQGIAKLFEKALAALEKRI